MPRPVADRQERGLPGRMVVEREAPVWRWLMTYFALPLRCCPRPQRRHRLRRNQQPQALRAKQMPAIGRAETYPVLVCRRGGQG